MMERWDEKGSECFICFLEFWIYVKLSPTIDRNSEVDILWIMATVVGFYDSLVKFARGNTRNRSNLGYLRLRL